MDYLYANIDADIIDSGEIKFTTVSAEVDNNSGTPSVDVSLRDDTDLHFFFHNLKGDQGAEGPEGKAGVQGPQGIQGAGLGPEGTLPWVKITSVPASYTPSAHTHTISEIDNLRIELDNLDDTKADIGGVTEALSLKQDVLTAGDNITIEDNIISANTDPDVINEIDSINESIVNINSGINEMADAFTVAETRLSDAESDISTNANNITTNTSEIASLSSSVTTLNGSVGALATAVSGLNNNVTLLQDNKVDKESGKGLSTNDFTNGYKNKLDGISSLAQVNTIEGIKLNGVNLSPDEDKIVNLGSLVTDVSLENLTSRVNTLETESENYVEKETGKGLSTNDYTNEDKALVETINNKVDKIENKGLSTNDYTNEDKALVETITDKVDKETGKVLSTNDYTDEDKTKLDDIMSGAQVNTIEKIILNGDEMLPESKTVDLGNLVTSETLEETFYNDGELNVVLKTDIQTEVPSEPDDSHILSTLGIKSYVESYVDEYVDDKLKPIIEEIGEIKRDVVTIKSSLENL